MPAGVSLRPARVMMTADAVGGVWTYALDLARGFAARDIETILVTIGPSPNPAQRDAVRSIRSVRLIDSGLPLDWTASNEEELCRTAQLLAELAAGLRPEIIHLNTPALAAGLRYPAPVVAMAHSCLGTWWRAMRREPPPPDFRWRIRLTGGGFAGADAVIVATDSFASALREVYGDDLPIAVVANGRRSTPGEVEKRRIIFTAGRLWDEGKNIALLDCVAARTDTPIFAAGPLSGPNGAVADFPHLRLLGSLAERDIAPWYAAASIFASPARSEPFGLAALQAAQAGAALVLADIPTFRELWRGAAVFIEANDETAWRETLEALQASPERTARLGAAARARAARYSVDAMVDGTLEVYRRVLVPKRQPATLLHSAS
jgi:glycosyltransferase involved in cell wall biosynthesis